MLDTTDPSLELVDFWNEILVPKFVRYRDVLVDGLGHHSAAVLPRLEICDGDRVLDVGCGFGDTAILLAQRVAPSGSVVGLDCCEGFLGLARADAAASGVRNLAFIEADAQCYAFEPEFDHVFSRFGTMFFANPVAALKNLRSALRPGGRMTMIVWRRLAENPWARVPKEIVLDFLPPPGDDGRNCGPGPFSMADRGTLARQLEIAGYEDVAFEPIDVPIVVGRDAEEAVGLALALGPAGEVFREAGGEAESRRTDIESALRRKFTTYANGDGIAMPSSSWCVSARRPA